MVRNNREQNYKNRQRYIYIGICIYVYVYVYIHIYVDRDIEIDMDIHIRQQYEAHTTMHRRRVPAISQSADGKKIICACAEKIPGTTKANPGVEGKCKWKL